MRTLLPLLIVLACPLMMIFMMRGMHGGGHDMNHDDTGSDMRHDSSGRDSSRTAAPTALAPKSGRDPETRITELEREVADLRAAGNRVQLNKPASKT